MKEHIRTNWPAEIDPGEREVIVTFHVHSAEKQTHFYPGSEAYIEYLAVETVGTGCVLDWYALSPREQEALMGRCGSILEETHA